VRRQNSRTADPSGVRRVERSVHSLKKEGAAVAKKATKKKAGGKKKGR
jgi:hypothetical protein